MNAGFTRRSGQPSASDLIVKFQEQLTRGASDQAAAPSLLQPVDRALHNCGADNRFPCPVRIASRAVAWRRTDLDRWSESSPVVTH